MFCCFKQKTAYDMRISDWSSDVCSSDLLRDWFEREHPVAVGECGLDHFVEGLDHDAQQSCFEGQLALAREYDLPVIVHARRVVDAVVASIRSVGKLRGVVHSWSGSRQQAEQLWDLGFMLEIGSAHV